MLRVDLRAISRGPLVIDGTIPPDEPFLEGGELDLRAPVRVTGRLTAAGPGRFYWDGRIVTTVGGECRRCLAPIAAPVDVEVNLLFTDDVDTDDPAVYIIPDRSEHLELGEAVREELVLAAPKYVLCRDDCRGLCVQCGKDLNRGPCGCRPPVDPRWAALEALRDVAPANEES